MKSCVLSTSACRGVSSCLLAYRPSSERLLQGARALGDLHLALSLRCQALVGMACVLVSLALRAQRTVRPGIWAFHKQAPEIAAPAKRPPVPTPPLAGCVSRDATAAGSALLRSARIGLSPLELAWLDSTELGSALPNSAPLRTRTLRAQRKEVSLRPQMHVFALSSGG